MKILGICGSLREGSNTNKIVKKIVESSGIDYEIVDLTGKEIRPCTGCYHCMMNEGVCSQNDDMVPVYTSLMEADAIVFGAPTYYLDISGAAKDLIDRSMAIFYRGVGEDAEMEVLGKRPLAGKPAVAVSTAAGGGHERAVETLKIYFEVNRMKVIDQLPLAVGMGDVDDMPEMIKRAQDAGKKLGDALRKK